jgi:hypothetical protein
LAINFPKCRKRKGKKVSRKVCALEENSVWVEVRFLQLNLVFERAMFLKEWQLIIEASFCENLSF